MSKLTFEIKSRRMPETTVAQKVIEAVDKTFANPDREDNGILTITRAEPERTHGRDLTPEQFIQTIGEFVNTQVRAVDRPDSKQYAALSEQIRREHRTLQRGIYCLAVTILETLASTPQRRIDGRNEQSCANATELVGAVDFLPDGRPWLV